MTKLKKNENGIFEVNEAVDVSNIDEKILKILKKLGTIVKNIPAGNARQLTIKVSGMNALEKKDLLILAKHPLFSALWPEGIDKLGVEVFTK